MMKDILIDALHITTGGGKVLLDYMIGQMLVRGYDFTLLLDERCLNLKNIDRVNNVLVLPDSILARTRFYKKHKSDFRFVLCFGNIPPMAKMDSPTYTYVHNINLLKIPISYSIARKFVTWMKQKYISYYSKYTDGWIVQTDNTASCLKKSLPCNGKRLLVLPFFHIPNNFFHVKSISKECRSDYILVGDYTGAKGHEELVDAWTLLYKSGFRARLHLTVSGNERLLRKIRESKRIGVDIVNHGVVPFDNIVSLYGKCKATVYPSINESLGLGIIEAVNAGCDVIGPNLPYIYNVTIPSATFESSDPKSIAEAILHYERENCPKSKLTITDKIEALMDLMSPNK